MALVAQTVIAVLGSDKFQATLGKRGLFQSKMQLGLLFKHTEQGCLQRQGLRETVFVLVLQPL